MKRRLARLPFASLAALVALAFATIVLAAQAGWGFCANRVTVPMPDMPDMPGMDMSGSAGGMEMHGMPMLQAGGVTICPIVLGLIVAVTLLVGALLIVLAPDPEREAEERVWPRPVRAVLLRFPKPPIRIGAPLLATGRALRAPPAIVR